MDTFEVRMQIERPDSLDWVDTELLSINLATFLQQVIRDTMKEHYPEYPIQVCVDPHTDSQHITPVITFECERLDTELDAFCEAMTLHIPQLCQHYFDHVEGI